MSTKFIQELPKKVDQTGHYLDPIWRAMVTRCYNKNCKAYKRYGGRGIKVCERWLEPYNKGFWNFVEDMGERPEGCSLDRINNDYGYCPENCRWATLKEQHRNMSINRVIIYAGESKTLVEWSEETGIKQTTLMMRLDRYGWTPEEALTLPRNARVNTKNRKKRGE
jgi:hypothetical protein